MDETLNKYTSLKSYVEIIFKDDKNQAASFPFEEFFHNGRNITKETACDKPIFFSK